MSQKDIFQKINISLTKHRLSVYSILEKNHKPLSVQNIYDKLQSTGIDKVTVYRTLKTFLDKGIVKQIDFNDSQVYFELVDEHDHHHVICKKCQSISDFVGCHIDTIVKDALKQTNFSRVESHSFELFGICKKCDK